MINRTKTFYLALATFFLFWSCEEAFIPVDSGVESQIVVEGFIEAGEDALPTYVILTRTFPFYSNITSDRLNDLFVRDAAVVVSKEGGEAVQLTELCLDDIPEDLRREVAVFLGIDLDATDSLPNICAYLDVQGEIIPEEGATYSLSVEVEGQVLTASTMIPEHVHLDSIWFTDPPGEPNNTLAEMNCLISDPGGVENYYRYLTAVNSRPLIPTFGSVTDDAFFDGQQFSFPLQKAEYISDSTDLDFNTFGLWERGDTARLKWCGVDKAHHDFWLTFEFNRNNQGPFSSYTRVDFNIEGGIGIWGGYSVSHYQLVVPEK